MLKYQRPRQGQCGHILLFYKMLQFFFSLLLSLTLSSGWKCRVLFSGEIFVTFLAMEYGKGNIGFCFSFSTMYASSSMHLFILYFAKLAWYPNILVCKWLFLVYVWSGVLSCNLVAWPAALLPCHMTNYQLVFL